MAKEILTLSADKREGSGTRASRRLRSEGRVPCIVYGHKQEPTPISVPEIDLANAVRHRARMLDLGFGGDRERVLLSEVQYDAFGMDIVHADFIRVAMDELITVGVPVLLRGKAKGEAKGGVTELLMTEIEVECFPGDIPDNIPVIVAELEIGDSVHVHKLVAPAKVKIVSDPNQLVLTVAAPVKIEEVAPAAIVAEGEEAAAAGPEIIAKGKGEEEAADGDEKKKK